MYLRLVPFFYGVVLVVVIVVIIVGIPFFGTPQLISSEMAKLNRRDLPLGGLWQFIGPS
jgi:hypothetical protein